MRHIEVLDGLHNIGGGPVLVLELAQSLDLIVNDAFLTQLRVALLRMSRDGFVKITREAPTGRMGRPRNFYEITRHGIDRVSWKRTHPE